MKLISSFFKANKILEVDQQNKNEKNTAILIAGLAESPKVFKYILNIQESDNKTINLLKLSVNYTNTLLVAKSLSDSFGGAEKMTAGLLRSGLLENLGNLKSSQTAAIIDEVFKSIKVQGSEIKNINQDSLNAFVDKIVTVISSMKGQENLLKDVGNILADIVEASSTPEKMAIISKKLSVLYDAVKDLNVQKTIHELIEQTAKTFADPAILNRIVTKISDNPIVKLLPSDAHKKKKLILSTINYVSELTNALLPKQKETLALVNKLKEHKARSEEYEVIKESFSKKEAASKNMQYNKLAKTLRVAVKPFLSNKTEIDQLKNKKEEAKDKNNQSLKSLLTTAMPLLKDKKVMETNSKFLNSNKDGIATIINKKLNEERIKSQTRENSTWKSWFVDKALNKINGEFCVKLLQDTNTPKGLEAVDRLIENPGVINGIRVAMVTKSAGLLAKTLIYGVKKDQASTSKQVETTHRFNPRQMQEDYKSDSTLLTNLPAKKKPQQRIVPTL